MKRTAKAVAPTVVEEEVPEEETAIQRTVKSQYAAFRHYLEADLPDGPDKDRALASLAISQEAAYSAGVQAE